jgi:FkbM family methyltransferase
VTAHSLELRSGLNLLVSTRRAIREQTPVLKFVWNHPLNADGRIAALGRVAWWQLMSRMRSRAIALPFVDGTFLFATRGMTGATGNWYCGLHELPEMAFVLHLLRPGDHFIDVGANVGSYTVLAAGAAGATVTSVEPVPRTFRSLQRNILHNRLQHLVRAWQAGVSDSRGTLRFTDDLDAMNHVVTDGESRSALEVPTRTIDELSEGNVPILIKIDVEGYERQALIGARRTLADARLIAVVIETNGNTARYGASDAGVTMMMKEQGFEACLYDPFARRLSRGPAEPGQNGNTIFVRNRVTAEARLRSARHYRLVNGRI